MQCVEVLRCTFLKTVLRATCQAVRNFWLLVGPKLCVRPEQCPRVGLPAPEPEPDIVEIGSTAAFPASPL
eukprot:2325097-Amphidinium_carterae.1